MFSLVDLAKFSYLVVDPEEGYSWVIFFYYKRLQWFFALSIATTIFNKRILGFPQAIGVPLVSAIFVFILQWGASLLNGNQFITINIHNIEEAVRHIDFYDFLINGVICFILTSSALKFKISDLKSYWKQISILATIALVLCAVLFGQFTLRIPITGWISCANSGAVTFRCSFRGNRPNWY